MKALITGSNRGIGFEIARQLGKKGYTVFITAKETADRLEAISKLDKMGVPCKGFLSGYEISF